MSRRSFAPGSPTGLRPAPSAIGTAAALATIGKRAAIIDFGWIKLRGRLAWWMWGVAHIYFLIGLRHRLSVAMNWLWINTSGQRSARLITQGRAAEGYKFGAGRDADLPDRG